MPQGTGEALKEWWADTVQGFKEWRKVPDPEVRWIGCEGVDGWHMPSYICRHMLAPLHTHMRTQHSHLPCPSQDFLPPLCDTAMWCVPKHSWLRHKIVALVHWKVFEALTLLAILANCVTLALDRWVCVEKRGVVCACVQA